jgi:sialate O-acetylesterase
MVLQSGTMIRLWGWSKAGDTVSADLNKQHAVTQADATGKWILVLPAMPKGGPYELKISNGQESKSVSDVLVGEVWLGSGQSNMAFQMGQTSDAAEELPKAKQEKIRLFLVENHSSSKPAQDLKGSWKLCSPENAKPFAAVLYHFGKDLQGELDTPMGLIASAWGGSPAEAWTPREPFDSNPVLKARAMEMEKDKLNLEIWGKGLDYEIQVKDLKLIPKAAGAAALPAIPASSWSHSEKPGSTAELKAGEKEARLKGWAEGGAWVSMNASFSPSADFSGAEAVEFSARGKGKFGMSMHQPSVQDWDDFASEPFSLEADWKKIRVPLASLKQAGWGAHQEFQPAAIQSLVFGLRQPSWPDLPAVIYNSMIAPMTPYAIKGAIWYQGESNAGRAGEYHLLLSSMLRAWRSAWDLGDFPFYIVQLPNWSGGGGSWPALRQAQLEMLDQPNVGVSVALDLGESKDIHPHDKHTVGSRLARLALAQTYGKGGIGAASAGPIAQSAKAQGSKVLVQFKNAESGLKAKGELKEFEVAGADGVYKEASAKIVKGGLLELSSPAVEAPLSARYAWKDDPIACLYNKEGLPAAPFELKELKAPK